MVLLPMNSLSNFLIIWYWILIPSSSSSLWSSSQVTWLSLHKTISCQKQFCLEAFKRALNFGYDDATNIVHYSSTLILWRSDYYCLLQPIEFRSLSKSLAFISKKNGLFINFMPASKEQQPELNRCRKRSRAELITMGKNDSTTLVGLANESLLKRLNENLFPFCWELVVKVIF